MSRRLALSHNSLRHDESGSIAVEFALVAPLLIFILAGVMDIGSATYIKLSLDSRLTSTAEYALLQPAPGDQEAAEVLAGNLVGLLQGGAIDTAQVIVNNGADATWDGTAATVSLLSGDAASCYCPTLSQDGVDWGPSTACGTECTSGDTAGQFVQISATARHIAVFPGYDFIEDGTVSARTVLRLQ
jgi:Flp pilus assembly protein TadG